MSVSLRGEVIAIPEVIGRFARFLGELTGEHPAAEVHAVVARHVEVPGHDPRVDGALADSEVFATMWNGLIEGARVPDRAWEQVVLPAVVAFSNGTNLKAHLELAASFWVGARSAWAVLPVADTVVLKPESVAAGSLREGEPLPAPAGDPPRRRRWAWPWGVALVAVFALAATLLAWWL